MLSAHWKQASKVFGYPKSIRADNGPEFISRYNAFIESFNGKECLNTHWFMRLDDARQKMEDWRRAYNEVSTPQLYWKQTTNLSVKTHGSISATVSPKLGKSSSRVNLTSGSSH